MADNILAIGESFLDETLKQYASEVVEYRLRGVSQWKKVNAVVGGTMFSGNDTNGFLIHTRSIDFIISVQELQHEPVAGDVIVRNGQLFEVFTPNNEPCWRYSGGTNETYRIHTQAIGNDEYHPLEV